jgi:hypothetical protein
VGTTVGNTNYPRTSDSVPKKRSHVAQSIGRFIMLVECARDATHFVIGKILY